jgi:hypothetical protein
MFEFPGSVLDVLVQLCLQLFGLDWISTCLLDEVPTPPFRCAVVQNLLAHVVHIIQLHLRCSTSLNDRGAQRKNTRPGWLEGQGGDVGPEGLAGDAGDAERVAGVERVAAHLGAHGDAGATHVGQ